MLICISGAVATCSYQWWISVEGSLGRNPFEISGSLEKFYWNSYALRYRGTVHEVRSVAGGYILLALIVLKY